MTKAAYFATKTEIIFYLPMNTLLRLRQISKKLRKIVKLLLTRRIINVKRFSPELLSLADRFTVDQLKPVSELENISIAVTNYMAVSLTDLKLLSDKGLKRVGRIDLTVSKKEEQILKNIGSPYKFDFIEFCFVNPTNSCRCKNIASDSIRTVFFNNIVKFSEHFSSVFNSAREIVLEQCSFDVEFLNSIKSLVSLEIKCGETAQGHLKAPNLKKFKLNRAKWEVTCCSAFLHEIELEDTEWTANLQEFVFNQPRLKVLIIRELSGFKPNLHFNIRNIRQISVTDTDFSQFSKYLTSRVFYIGDSN